MPIVRSLRFCFVGRLPPNPPAPAVPLFQVLHGAEMINKKNVNKVSGKSNDLFENYTCAQNVDNNQPHKRFTSDCFCLRQPATSAGNEHSERRETRERAKQSNNTLPGALFRFSSLATLVTCSRKYAVNPKLSTVEK